MRADRDEHSRFSTNSMSFAIERSSGQTTLASDAAMHARADFIASTFGVQCDIDFPYFFPYPEMTKAA